MDNEASAYERHPEAVAELVRLHKAGPMKHYLLSLPEEVHAAAKVRAAQEKITLASLIQRAILSYLGNEGGPSRQSQKRRKTK